MKNMQYRDIVIILKKFLEGNIIDIDIGFFRCDLSIIIFKKLLKYFLETEKKNIEYKFSWK